MGAMSLKRHGIRHISRRLALFILFWGNGELVSFPVAVNFGAFKSFCTLYVFMRVTKFYKTFNINSNCSLSFSAICP